MQFNQKSDKCFYMRKITGDEPFMPIFSEPIANDGYGLTIRQHFAAIAMSGYCANPEAWKEFTREDIVAASVGTADALIKELNK